MNPHAHRLWQQARRQRVRQAGWLLVAPAIATVITLPVLEGWAMGFLLASMALLALWLGRTLRAMDPRWLVRQLNHDPALQDSADLLLAPADSLNPLQQRLRGQLELHLPSHAPLATPWPRWGRGLSVLAAVLLVLATRLPPLWTPSQVPTSNDTPASKQTATTAPVLEQVSLQVRPPAYSGQPAQQLDVLEARALAGSRLHWRLGFSTPVDSAQLQFNDGRVLDLARREDGLWDGDLVLDRDALYRIVTEPALADTRLHRLHSVADAPPQVRVLQPEQALTPAPAQQKTWRLQFEASDDIGLATSAQLLVTLAQGSGEQITSRETRLTLQGSGNATRKRFSHTLDLAALGAGPGDDVIARLTVRDNRQPQPQSVHSASVILRLASEEQQQASDMEGAIKKVMPAYFRSQRQIILDAEALIAQRRQLDEPRFVQRSDAIGVDQRILRLRYGQFLGEEAEGGPKPPPGLPTADGDDGDTHAHQAGDGHDHDHADGNVSEPVMGTGKVQDLLAEYGHTHDHAEAATLLDPQTRATLKAALDAMWLSEGELRQGRPQQALPHAYRALGFIKQVQQSERIYLARLGPQLPPIDAARRMTGKRDGLASRRLPLAPAPVTATPLSALWQAMQARQPLDLGGLSLWLQANGNGLGDPLSLTAAAETAQAEPDCAPCRDELRRQLWQAWPQPLTRPRPRTAPDAMGQRYLDAVEGK